MNRQAVVEPIGADRCRVVAGSWSWDRLAVWAGMFEVDMEIVGPDELRCAAARLARRFQAAAGDAVDEVSCVNDEGPRSASPRPGPFTVCLNQSGQGGS